MRLEHNFSLKPFNTFNFDVKAKTFFEYDTENELINFLRQQPPNEKLLQIGQGSNLLFLNDFDGTILHSNINFIEVNKIENSSVFVRVGAGMIWDKFCKKMVESQYYGAENLSLVYGETGAAAVQNIGAYGVEIKDIIYSAETIDIQTVTKKIFSVAECRYGYRESIFKGELKGRYIVTAVNFKLSTEKHFNLEYGAIKNCLSDSQNLTIQAVRDTIIKIRTERLPNPDELGNAGSFFKNPYCCTKHFEALKKIYQNIPYYAVNEEVVKLSAAWLIEQCGWRGKRTGNAGTYPLQPLVLVAYENAKPQEIKYLAEQIQKSVFEKFNIGLECEVNFIE